MLVSSRLHWAAPFALSILSAACDSSEPSRPVVDCAGVEGGSATVDACGTCVGGSTGVAACDCAGEPGGKAVLDACGECVGGQTGRTACEADCAQVAGGSAFVDACGQCVGGDTGKKPCVADCAHDLGGSAFVDGCGECVGGSTGLTACTRDCADIAGGTAFVDDCGECAGGDTGRPPCATDCNKMPGGHAYMDDCERCVGEGTGLTACIADCNDDLGGTAFIDDCGKCVGGATGKSACGQDCASELGGSAYEDDCGQCVGGNTGRTACQIDCSGLPGGVAYRDDCGQCVGGNTGRTPCKEDCNHELGGSAFVDECNQCVGGSTNKSACRRDCNDTWGGSAFVDECNHCVGGSTGRSACTKDCANVFGGEAFVDECKQCVGGSTGKAACVQDCANVWSGKAFVDECKQCVGGSTGKSACVQDCNGQWGGMAALDACGRCAGGTTGRTPCAIDCNEVPGGSAQIDGCGVCAGGNTGRTPCAKDCAKVLGGTAYYDECDHCVGGTTGRVACEQDCADIWGGSAFYDQCDQCVGGSTGETPCSQDCAKVWGGSAYLDTCGICVGGSTGRMACGLDCANVMGGSAFVDDCGECVGGTTGRSACEPDCDGDFGGGAFVDACNVCVGGATGHSACASDCTGAAGGNAKYDDCGACVGGTTGKSACTPVVCRVGTDYSSPQAAIADERCQVIEVGAGRFFGRFGTARSLVIRGAGRDATVFDAGGFRRTLFVGGEGVVVRLEHLSITGGADEAGGIEVRDATLELNDVRVFGNESPHAYGHGGVWAERAHVRIVGSSIDSNQCKSCDGAGLYARDSTLVMIDSAVENNVINEALLAEGAGLHIRGGSLRAQRVRLASNKILGDSGDGAALVVNDASTELVDCTFEANRIETSDRGAGLALQAFTDQPFVMRRSVIRDNGEQVSGTTVNGRVFSIGATGLPAHVEDVTITGNRVVYPGEGSSMHVTTGLLHASGRVLFRRVQVRGNAVDAPQCSIYGGVIGAESSLKPSLVRFVESELVSNEVQGRQAIGAIATVDRDARLVFSRSLIAQNRIQLSSRSAGEAATLLNQWEATGSMLLHASTVHGNTMQLAAAPRTGIVADTNGGTIELVNATVTDNVGTGAGAFAQPFTGELYAAHSVFAGNRASDQACSAEAHPPALFAGHHNWFFNPQRCETNSERTTAFGTDPKLLPLADNGGPTQSRAPDRDSPLVNFGARTCSARAFDRALTLDQRGESRPKGAACDVGSVELR